jgi:hypothetical protein
MLLLEVHLLVRPTQRSPVTDAPLHRPHLTHREALGVVIDEQLHQRLGLELGLAVDLEQRLDLGCPDVFEWIFARAPVPGFLGLRWQRARLPLAC